MGDWTRPLTPDEQRIIAAARDGARLRYEGTVVPHRSCGIALAETFGRATAPYQSLRRGGLTGHGECGTAVATRLIAGELLGDPDPAGPATPVLRVVARELHERWGQRVGTGGTVVCNALVDRFPDFRGPARKQFCTQLAAESAALLAEVLLRNGVVVEVEPLVG